MALSHLGAASVTRSGFSALMTPPLVSMNSTWEKCERAIACCSVFAMVS